MNCNAALCKVEQVQAVLVQAVTQWDGYQNELRDTKTSFDLERSTLSTHITSLERKLEEYQANMAAYKQQEEALTSHCKYLEDTILQEREHS